MERLCEQAYTLVRRGGASARDRLPAGDRRASRRSRPTATGCSRSSRTCSRTRSAGRPTAAGSSSSSRPRTARSRSRSRHGARDRGGGAGAHLPPVLVARRLGHRARPRDRQRARRRARRPDRAGELRRARAAASRSCCPDRRSLPPWPTDPPSTTRPSVAALAAAAAAAVDEEPAGLRRDHLRRRARDPHRAGSRRPPRSSRTAPPRAPAYLVNDVRDVEHDRLHPIKRHAARCARRASSRRGRRSPPPAILAVAALRARGRARAAGRCVVLLRFLALQAAYSARAQARRADRRDGDRAGCSSIRAAAGAVGRARAASRPGSCSARRCSRSSSRSRSAAASSCSSAPSDTRAAGARGLLARARRPARHDRRRLDRDRLLALHVHRARLEATMMATIPFVLFGVFRYLLLIHREDVGRGAGAGAALRPADPRLTVALWALTSALILLLN